MSELDLKSFREVELADKERLDPILAASGKLSSGYTFSNLYCWGEIFKIVWTIYNGSLLLYGGRDDFLFMPVGKEPDLSGMLFISDEFKRQGRSGNFILVAADYVENNSELLKHFRAEVDEDNADYLYLSRKLYELKGKKLHKKKNLVAQFSRNNPGYVYRAMEKRDREGCFILAEKWCEVKSCEEIGFTHETSALKRALENFDALGLEGVVIFVRDKLVAFAICSEQNKSTADVHFEKYDPEIKGSAQVINWEMAKHLMGRYEYINREEDMGIEGLRKAKSSYCPEFTAKTYRLYRTG